MNILLRVLVLAVVVLAVALSGCSTVQSILPIVPTAHADCVLADELQRQESVTPIPEDHDLTLQETWDVLRSRLIEAKSIADRSNDKTNFVNKNCAGAGDGAVK